MTTQLLALLSAPRHVGLAHLARVFAEISSADGAVIFLSDGSTLRIGGSHPQAPAETVASLRIGFGQGASGQVAQHGHAMRLAADAPRTQGFRDLIGLSSPEAAVARLCLPARGLDGSIFGVVSLHRPTSRPFTDDDVTHLQPFADLLGMRIQLRGLRDAVDAHHSERERLIEAAVSAQEDERRRIAYDLHDGVTTALASMSFHLNAAELSLAPEPEGGGEDGFGSPARNQIAVARSLADLAYDQTRAAITGLHSLVLSDLGLVAALESIASTSPGVPVQVTCEAGASFADLPRHMAATLFRIAQEATANAARHAQADLVRIELWRRAGKVWLTVSDDGVGFDVRAAANEPQPDDDRPHFGLASIAERSALIGASLRIDSARGQGTTITVELPLDSQ